LKQRLEFTVENKFKAMDIIPKTQGQTTVKTTVSLSFEKEIETMDSLPKI